MTDTMTTAEYRAATLKPSTMPREKADLDRWLDKGMDVALPLATEYRFHPERKWRFDWAFPSIKVAVEYDGLYGGKAHTSIRMVAKDSEKMNQAQLLGWLVVRVNAQSLRDGSGYRDIDDAIRLRTLTAATPSPDAAGRK